MSSKLPLGDHEPIAPVTAMLPFEATASGIALNLLMTQGISFPSATSYALAPTP